MTINKYLPFAFVYFFLNTVALPFGLTYTALLAPLFYVWILFVRKREVLLPFIVLLLPYIIVHLTIVDADTDIYAVSLLNAVLVYIFCQAVYTFLIVCKDVEKIFRSILICNFILCLLAIPLYFTAWNYLMWDEQILTENVGRVTRFKMFTYEPSYYALLFTPLFFYFLLQYLFKQNNIRGALLLPMLFLPYFLSFSIGVISTIFIATLLTWLFYFKRLTRRRRIANSVLTSSAIVGLIILVVFFFFRNNQLFLRLSNVISGRDTSGKGRTVDAFVLAHKILQEKNEYFGIGLGQIKIAGGDIIRSYYFYDFDITATIPNAAAETLAIFGWTGFVFRIGLELFLFIHTRVWTNYYRLALFTFIFIYQFTGSFITNIAEYVIWILAFTNVFPQFDIRREKKLQSLY